MFACRLFLLSFGFIDIYFYNFKILTFTLMFLFRYTFRFVLLHSVYSVVEFNMGYEMVVVVVKFVVFTIVFCVVVVVFNVVVVKEKSATKALLKMFVHCASEFCRLSFIKLEFGISNKLANRNVIFIVNWTFVSCVSILNMFTSMLCKPSI